MQLSALSYWLAPYTMSIYFKKEDTPKKQPLDYDPFHRPDELPPMRESDREPGVEEPDSPYNPSPNKPESFVHRVQVL